MFILNLFSKLIFLDIHQILRNKYLNSIIYSPSLMKYYWSFDINFCYNQPIDFILCSFFSWFFLNFLIIFIHEAPWAISTLKVNIYNHFFDQAHQKLLFFTYSKFWFRFLNQLIFPNVLITQFLLFFCSTQFSLIKLLIFSLN